MLSVTIDRQSGVPLYLQIRDQITYEISVSGLPVGTVLPSIRQVAAQAGVATATVRHAYASLAEDGYVVPQQGKGMLVAELEHRHCESEQDARAQTLSMFSSAIGRAFALGANAETIKMAFAKALVQWTGEGRVLFVVTESEFIEHYAPLLAVNLEDLNVKIVAIHLDDLPKHLDLDDPFTLPLCVVTLVRSYGTVRQAFGSTDVPIVGLTLNLSDKTKAAIINLLRETRVVLITERMSLKGISTLLEQYLVVDRPFEAHALEAAECREAVRTADIVVHTLRGRQTIMRHRPQGAATLELHFEPDPVSLQRLRRTIVTQQRGSEV